jgi:REP element-mobilizing transposase RayT
MARYRRIEIAGGLAHVISRGIDGIDIFRDDSDRQQFLARLSRGLHRTGFKCLAWALMSNHYHLAIRTTDDRLTRLMQGLNGGYARWFNKKYSRKGYLLQDRFKSILCQDSLYAKELIRYIHLNPIRAGVVKDLNALKHYYWCGHRSILGNNEGCIWQEIKEVQKLFGRSVTASQEAYVAFLIEGLEKGGHTIMPDILPSEKGGDAKSNSNKKIIDSVLGDSAFIRQALSGKNDRTLLIHKLRADGWHIERIAGAVARQFEISRSELTKPWTKTTPAKARAILALLAYRMLGYSTIEIAHYLGIKQPGVSVLCRKAEKSIEEKGQSCEEVFAELASYEKH